jgi:basic membrane protein A
MACGGAADVDDYKAAFVYLGSANDGGWTQAHDEGRQYLVEETGIETAFTEDVPPDATEFRTVAEAYIEQGYNIIFGTTFGYLDIMEEMALEYPDVTFLHCSGYKSNDSNYTNYFGKIYEARYLSGLAAGSLTESNKIGYVAAFPIPEVIRGINAFANGVKEVNPNATVEVVWTNTWFGPEEETQAANALLEAGADVLTQHQDSASTGIAAEAAGAKWIGYHTGYGKEAEFTTTPYWTGMSGNVVDLFEVSDDVSSDIKTLIEDRKQEIIDGTFEIFEGSSDGDLLGMSYFVDNVVGTLD